MVVVVGRVGRQAVIDLGVHAALHLVQVILIGGEGALLLIVESVESHILQLAGAI